MYSIQEPIRLSIRRGNNICFGTATSDSFEMLAAVQHAAARQSSQPPSLFNHQLVLLPPPAGLFPNWSASSPFVGRVGDPLQTHINLLHQAPLIQGRDPHSTDNTDRDQKEVRSNSSSDQRRAREGADSDGSDDNHSQCSTASYDGSQRCKSKSGNTENREMKGEKINSNASAKAGQDDSRSAVTSESQGDAQDFKKRTWKVLLSPEQACEVRSKQRRAGRSTPARCIRAPSEQVGQITVDTCN